MTALVLIITGNVNAANASLNDAQAILLTSGAFESAISWFPYVLTIAVVLFAFSTMISWSYYGFQGWAYLFGRSKKMEYTYKIIFCLFVVVGAAASLGSVIGFSDAMIFAMMVPNMVGIVILAPKVKNELEKYLKVIKKSKPLIKCSIASLFHKTTTNLNSDFIFSLPCMACLKRLLKISEKYSK